MKIDILRSGRGYLATPYTLHPDGREYAYKVACALLANLTALKIRAYSPIAHWHMASVLDPQFRFKCFSPDDWFDLNKPEMDLSDWMLIPYDREEVWKESIGIRKEREYFDQCGKPVYFYEGACERVTALPSRHQLPAPGARPSELGQLLRVSLDNEVVPAPTPDA